MNKHNRKKELPIATPEMLKLWSKGAQVWRPAGTRERLGSFTPQTYYTSPVFVRVDKKYGYRQNICINCAEKPRSAYQCNTPPVAEVWPHEEGAPIECEECNAEIFSTYGDPSATECPQCGHENETGRIFCLKCSAQIAEPDESEAGRAKREAEGEEFKYMMQGGKPRSEEN